jgi:hypothetical protein
VASQSRKHRGYATQRLVAEWFAARGWPFAESAGAGRPGIDVTGIPGLACEVKARRGFNLTGFLRQATSERRHGLPFVVVRPDGYGPAKIGEWAMILTLADGTRLLQQAGYGDGLDTVDINDGAGGQLVEEQIT